MSVRVLLAVLVTAALVAAAAPAVHDAKQAVAASRTHRATERLHDAVMDIALTSDPVPRGVPGATRVVRVDPSEAGDDAAIVVGGGPGTEPIDGNRSDAVTGIGPSGSVRRSRVPVDVRVVVDGRVRPDDRGWEIRGSRRVVLRYVLLDGRPTVTVGSV